jgi:ATP-dependent DNA helicase DinG
VDTTMPEPGAGGSRARGPVAGGDGDVYARELVTRLLEHIEATGGGAFVLFTSFSTLNRAAGLIAEPLETLGYPLFVQGQGAAGGSRTALLEAFREAGNGVLFGAASFWQGVDVRGEALRNVIITRLPFEPPDRPLTEARLERIRAKGGDPFREDQLPRAVIRFKQGVGRLIRSHADRGRVVVLDPRIVTRGYGRAFLRALPEGVAVTELGAGE